MKAAPAPGSFPAAECNSALHAGVLLGLLRRERSGIAGIGFEGFFVLVLYGLGIVTISVS